MELAKIGPGVAGGNNRQTLTDEDSKARDLLRGWCDQAGLSTTVDAMGSIQRGLRRSRCSTSFDWEPS